MQFTAYILTFVVASSLNWSAITIHAPQVKADSIDLSAMTTQDIIDLTNRARLADGESYLRENTYLDHLAQARIEDLMEHDNFSHIDSHGEHSYQEVDTSIYPYKDFGENLAVLFTSAVTEQQAWMNSPEHVANILNPRYMDIGVGIVQGDYEGYPTTWVAVEFGDE
jgi:uncharacterized protein YkwD